MRRLLAPLALAVALAPVAARGDELEDAAKMHFETGQRFYRSGMWPQALAEFNAGFELTHRPGFLINLAKVHEQLGEWAEAVRVYRQFLEQAPDAPMAKHARAWLGLAAAHLPPEEKPPERPPDRPPEQRTRPVELAPAVAPAIVAPPPRLGFWHRKRRATWATTALTLASLGAAIGVEVLADQRYGQALNDCAPFCPADRVSGISDASHAAIGLFAAAGALALITIVLLFAEGR